MLDSTGIPRPPRNLLPGYAKGDALTEIAEKFFTVLQDHAGLQPHHKVLDIGSGIGRMALPLTQYLDAAQGGQYEGMDIQPKLVRWCQQEITSRYPNFRFDVIDAYNKYYNRRAKQQASNYRFPFPDAHFDLIFLVSVFTHMLPEGVENYLAEISRMLKPDGTAVITYFLLNEETETHIANDEVISKVFQFKHDYGIYRVSKKRVPERAVAYQETYIQEQYARFGLKIEEPILYGPWCSRSNVNQHYIIQDITIATRNKG